MKTPEILLSLLDEGYGRPAWHGPNLKASLRGLTPAQAAWRPAPAMHNIWELVLHCAYWKFTARRRITGDRKLRFPYPGSNFFPRDDGTPPAQWKIDLECLAEEHAALRAPVAASSTLSAQHIRTIRGVAAHDIYHAGQIQLIRKSMRLSAGSLDHAALWVTDLDRSRQFYQRWFQAASGPRYDSSKRKFSSYFLTLASGARLELMSAPGESPRPAHIAIYVGTPAEVDQLARRMAASGVPILDGPRQTGDGYYEAVIADPDGNPVEITAAGPAILPDVIISRHP